MEILFDPAADAEAVLLLEQGRCRFKRDLQLPGTPIVEVELLTAEADDELLAALTRLQRLRRVTANAFTPDQVLRLTKMRQLEILRIDQTKVGTAQIKALATMPRLLDLTLWCCTFEGDDALKEIARSPRLQAFDVGGCRSVTDESVKQLSRLKRLQSLSLYDTGVSNAALPEIAGWPNLRALNLGGTAITNAGLEKLGRSSSLAELKLQATNVDDDVLGPLCRISTLQYVDLNGCGKLNADGVRRLRTALPNCKIVGPTGLLQ